jgi:hypothetical protein
MNKKNYEIQCDGCNSPENLVFVNSLYIKLPSGWYHEDGGFWFSNGLSKGFFCSDMCLEKWSDNDSK